MAKSKLSAMTGGNGYCKLPDGTLIQWGSITVTTGSNGGTYPQYNGTMYTGIKSVTFPVPFVSVDFATATGDNIRYGSFDVEASTITTTGMSISGAHNAANVNVALTWLAIGKWK